jgi:hypothetical protein
MFHINQLIIIGGPSGSGKSFLIEKIQQGECPRLCSQLGITNPSSWLYVLAKDLNQIHPIVERLVVHYDLYAHQSKENEFNHLNRLINNSDRMIILTLNVPRSILIERVNSRLRRSLFSLIGVKSKKDLKEKLWNMYREWKIQKAYKHGVSELLYDKWFNYLDQFAITSHWLLDNYKSDTIVAYPYKMDKRGFFITLKK